MSKDMNIVAISGRLTRDAEVRQLPNGNSVTRIRIASNDQIKRGDEWVEVAYFFDVTAFGRMGENVARYLGKGDPLMVEGKLHWSEWDDKEGKTQQRVDITANKCIFFPKNSGSSKGERDDSGSGSTTYGGRPPAADDDDIPF